MSVKLGSARIDENGKAKGGQAGDQTGKEVSTQSYYLHSKGWRVFRAKEAAAAEKIAKCMENACKNNKIGYDQGQRNTLYKVAEPLGFDTSKVTTACETDCSALVRVCCAFAGIMGLPSGFRTGNMPTNLMNTGKFVEMKGAKYQEQSAYLKRGDILVTKTSGHTVVVLSNGSKAESDKIEETKSESLGDRVLKYGCEGTDVKLMQEMLLKLGYDLGAWGCDGDFGDCTELALKAFQVMASIEASGVCDQATLEALQKAITALEDEAPDDGRTVKIAGGNCYIRTEPGTDGKALGVAHKGDTYPYAGETAANGWLAIRYKDQKAWVSGKYAKLVN